MNENIKRWDFDPEPFQWDFLLSRARYPAFVSGWATGKTMLAIAKAMELSLETPNNLGLIVRKNFTDLRDSTIKDFNTYTGYKVRTSKDVKLPNGSVIMFRHMDELSGVIQNVNLGWFFIEQAEEFDSKDEFERLRGRLRRKGCTHQGIIIANTNGHNWIWKLWKNQKDPDFHLTEAVTYDNEKNLDADYVADLRKLEKSSPHHYRRYVLNSWDDVDTADNVIPYEWLRRAVNKELIPDGPVKRVVAIDPAEMGDDRSVFYGLENGKVVAEEVTCKKSPMDTAGRGQRMMRDTGARLIVVDGGSGGFGVDHRLIELGVDVLPIKPGEKAENEEDYKNLKAQMWFNAREMFADDKVSIPDDEQLIEELAAHTYGFNSKGQIIIEKKRDVKKKLGGRSPDKADSFVMALWGLTKVEATGAVDLDTETAIAESYTVKSTFV